MTERVGWTGSVRSLAFRCEVGERRSTAKLRSTAHFTRIPHDARCTTHRADLRQSTAPAPAKAKAKKKISQPKAASVRIPCLVGVQSAAEAQLERRRVSFAWSEVGWLPAGRCTRPPLARWPRSGYRPLPTNRSTRALAGLPLAGRKATCKKPNSRPPSSGSGEALGMPGTWAPGCPSVGPFALPVQKSIPRNDELRWQLL